MRSKFMNIWSIASLTIAVCLPVPQPCPKGKEVCYQGAKLAKQCTSKPCEEYTTIDDYTRSTGFNKLNQHNPECDNNLIEGWHRFISSAGNHMPSSPPKGATSCNTNSPIWLRGSLPTQGGYARLVGCAKTLSNVCNRQYPIGVKHCGDYYVYYLKPTSSQCSPKERYCAGNKTNCQDGLRSINGDGIEPCSALFPNRPKEAIMHTPREMKGSDFEGVIFECSVVPEINQSYPTIHEFQFLAEDSSKTVELHTFESNNTKVFITDDHFARKGISLGKEISCRVRAIFTNADGNPDLKNASGSAWEQSNAIFVGVHVMMESGPLIAGEITSVKLTFNVTIPIVCNFYPYCKVSVFLGFEQRIIPALGCSAVDELASTSCNVIFYPESARTIEKEINIEVKASSLHSYESLYHLRVFTGEIDDPKIWHNYKIAEIPLRVNHPNGRIEGSTDCKSINDPHMTTFDGNYYHNYEEGVFLMYRNTELDYKVYTQTVKCGRASCNCLVAAEVEDDLLVIDSCKIQRVDYGLTRGFRFKNRKIKLFQNGVLAYGFFLESADDGRTLKITLPSGTVITVLDGHLDHLFNVLITPSNLDKPRGGKFDEGYRTRTEGLCGVYDKDRDFRTDLKPRETGAVMDSCFSSERGCYNKVLKKFPQQWRIHNTDFLSKGLPHKNKTRKHCVCIATGAILCNDSCSVTNSITSMGQGSFKDDVYPIDEDFQAEIFSVHRSVENINTNQRFPRSSRSALSNATDFCITTVSSTGAASALKDLPEGVELHSYIQGCIEDIMITNSTDWIDGTIESLRAEVLMVVGKNISLWNTNKKGDPVEPPTELVKQLCPRNCSDHGNCVNGTCECDSEHTGADCALERSTPPTLLFVPEKGLCDVRLRPCRATPIMGENFVDAANLTCYVRQLQIRQNGTTDLKEEVLVAKARFDSYQRIICPLFPTDRAVQPNYTETPIIAREMPAVGFKIKVSNDGRVKSNSIDLVSYDGQCVNCTGFGSMNCSQNVNADSCLIDGKCYAHLQSLSSNSCQICNATEDRTRWTRDYRKCLIGTECFAGGGYHNSTYCLKCQPTINNSHFLLDNDYCFIDETCIPQMMANPSNKCNICNKTENSNRWTRDHSKCMLGRECFDDGGHQNGTHCLKCKPKINNSNLTIESGFCFIEGKCYEDGMSKLEDECEVCNAADKVTAWTIRTGCQRLPKRDLVPHVIVITICVGVLLFVAIIVAIMTALKKHNKVAPMHTPSDSNGIPMSNSRPGDEYDMKENRRTKIEIADRTM
ncbi:unnamed protein product [Owenia fusiformis]|uniref:VWFD domain-containing protein n=1 Tax=Owenia fusiformis TaxID=6347 RepID=A0A8S4NG64_OWEFU|nr:unnamed protein product [Owenia fusiformis]